MANAQQVINYNQLSKLKLKSGFIIKKMRDPSVDLEREAMGFLNSQKSEFNKKVANNFEVNTE